MRNWREEKVYKKLDRSRQGVKVNGRQYITSRKEGNGK